MDWEGKTEELVHSMSTDKSEENVVMVRVML